MEIVLKYLGYLLLLFSVFPVIPIFVALHYGESTLPFIATVFVSITVAILLFRVAKDSKRTDLASFNLPRSISLSAMSFVTISLIGMLPYRIMAGRGFIDSFFESVSGFTTTGLTVFTDVESLPMSLLIWRAETQWIGGLGIVILFLVIVSAMRQQESLKETTTKAKAIANLYQAQGASEKLEANMMKSMRNTILIYGAYTFIGIILLAWAGLTTFEAVSISFTAISTAGFSVTNAFYTSWPVLLVVSFLMVAGSVTYVFHNRLLKGYLKEFLVNRGFRFYMIFLGAAVLLIFAFLGDFKVAFFQTLSAFTTSGFSIADNRLLPVVVIFALVCGMLVGGMLGSTAGGIKVSRLRIILKSIPWLMKRAVSPSEAVIPFKVDGTVMDDDSIIITHAFAAAYILILVAGTFVLMAVGVSFLDSSFQVVSALGGVGQQTVNLDVFPFIGKCVLIILMLLGRLEIFPLLVLGKFFLDGMKERMRRKEELGRKLFYTKWIPTELWKRKF